MAHIGLWSDERSMNCAVLSVSVVLYCNMISSQVYRKMKVCHSWGLPRTLRPLLNCKIF